MNTNIFKKLHQQQFQFQSNNNSGNRSLNPHNKAASTQAKQPVFNQITNLPTNTKTQNISKINRTEGSPPPISNQKRQHTEPSPNCLFKYRPKSHNKESVENNNNTSLNNNQINVQVQKENIATFSSTSCPTPINQQQQNQSAQVKHINVTKPSVVATQQSPNGNLSYFPESFLKQNSSLEQRNSNSGVSQIKNNITLDCGNSFNDHNQALVVEQQQQQKLQQSQSQLNLQQSQQKCYFLGQNLPQANITLQISNLSKQNINELEETKQSQDSSNSIGSISCAEHPEKRAKYYTINDVSVVYLCSKCAIDGALKGNRVVELKELKDDVNQYSNQKQVEKPDKLTLDDVYKMKGLIQQNFTTDQLQRKQEVEKFIMHLESLCTQCDYSLELIYSKKNDATKLLEEQKQNIDKLYNEIQTILQIEKENALQRMDKQIETSKAAQQKNEVKIQQFHNDMSNIKSDIFQNIDNILLNMDIKPFRLIISKYSEKIRTYEKQNEAMKNEQLALFKALNYELSCTKVEQEYRQSIIQSLSVPILGLVNKLESQDIKIQSNNDNRISSMYISFENKDMFENAVKAAEKVPVLKASKQDSIAAAITATISQSPEIKQKCSPIIKDDNIGNIIKSPNNAKYLDLLEKVNQNQANTNNFYSNIIKEHSITSPDREIFQQKRCTTPQNNNGNILQLSNQNDKTYRKEQKSTKESQHNNQQKKNYDHFMQFIESKLNDGQVKQQQQQHSNYQKTLFSSPHFKEDDQQLQIQTQYNQKQKCQRYA